MILTGELQLLAGVLRPSERAAREWGRRIRDSRNVGIAKERQNGVIERRRADFNLAARRRIAVRRENQAQKFLLFVIQRRLVFLRVVFALCGEAADDLILLEPGFFYPRKLGE